MNIPIFFNSVNGVRNFKSHDFTITFTPQLTLDKNKNYYLAVDSVNMSTYIEIQSLHWNYSGNRDITQWELFIW